MNDLIRPSFYGAYHEIVNLTRLDEPTTHTVQIVGPICESGDFLAKDRTISQPIVGDLLAMMSTGAYGFSMSSNYNSRPRAAEVLVHGNKFKICRKRETLKDLIRGENP